MITVTEYMEGLGLEARSLIGLTKMLSIEFNEYEKTKLFTRLEFDLKNFKEVYLSEDQSRYLLEVSPLHSLKTHLELLRSIFRYAIENLARVCKDKRVIRDLEKELWFLLDD